VPPRLRTRANPYSFFIWIRGTFMNRHTHKITAAAIALLGAMTLAGTAAAQQTALNNQAPASSATAPDKDEMRIRTLHDKLNITSAQEPLWNNVAQIMRNNDEKMDALAQERHDKAATMTAVEDLRSYEQITEAHAMGMKAFIPAFESLYLSMSDTQKAAADNAFRNMGPKAHKKAG
jgi:periplasmic protein CpxP/Spy